jgi:plastocyanin
MKVVSASLLVILIAVLAFDFYIVSQNKTPLPTPVNKIVASIPPIATSGPREITKEKVQYNPVIPKIDIRNFATNPSTLTIKKNTIVTWTNFDKDTHQIVGDKWKSRVLKENDTFSQAFEKSGSFPYKEPQSPQLNGFIVVEE